MKDPIELLSQKNINKPKLLEYIKDTCDYCTDYQLPDLDFALNHHGEPDVALFDFTSMFAASNSCYVKEKYGKQLLVGLVGDGLLEPFWPTGSGKIFVKITIIFQICFCFFQNKKKMHFLIFCIHMSIYSYYNPYQVPKIRFWP